MRARPKAVIILGMHRSGTSLLAKTVQSLGVYWGQEEQMIGPREDNPEGFWEHSEIVDIHEKMLSSMSSTWDTTKPLPADWWRSHEWVSYRAKIKDLVGNHFSNHSLWGFKDPRTCLLLPLWKSVLHELDIEPVYILCLRNPLNVAASLQKRDFFTNEKSFAIWTLYVLSSLYYTCDEKRLVVGYDHLLEQPVESGEKISQFLNIPYNNAERGMMDALPNSKLRHGNYTASDLWKTPSAPAILKQVYQIGLSGENHEDDFSSGALDASVASLYENMVQTVQLFNHERAYRMQMYWSGADGQFSEAKSTYITVNATDHIRSYRIHIKEDIRSTLLIHFIRELPYMRCSKIMLIQGAKETDLLQSGKMELVNFRMLSDRVAGRDEIEGISIGQDPQLIIRDIPDFPGKVTLVMDICYSSRIPEAMINQLLEQQRLSKEMKNQLLEQQRFSEEMKNRLVEQQRTSEEMKNQLLERQRFSEEKLQYALISSKQQIDQLQQINANHEGTIRLAADQLEKQLETLELFCHERQTREAEQRKLNRELQDQRVEIADLHSRLYEKEKLESHDLSIAMRQRELAIEQYRREMALYTGSLSWRITMPLRLLGDTARRSKKTVKVAAKSMLQRYIIQQNRRNGSTSLTGKFMYKKYAVIISHTHYLESMGGTEKYIYEQSSYLAQQDIGVIQIYPGQSYSLLDKKEGTFYGVVVDKQFRGFYSISDIGAWLLNLNIEMTTLYTHHLLYWQMSDYVSLYQQMKERLSSHTLYIHDFFTLCSSYHMIYEPKTAVSIKQADEKRPCISEIIASPGNNADICLNCKHGSQLSEWRQAIQAVITQVDEIIVPSKFVYDTVSAIYIDMASKIAVKSHLVFNRQKIIQKAKPAGRKIRIAYLGYKMNNKGWKLWERLYKNESLAQLYEFHHVGSQEDYSDRVVMHSYSFIKDGRMAAPNLLTKHDIDLVILWSIVPESYSYTLQESIAAGVPVITSTQSGNIAATIGLRPELGKVFHNEEQLQLFLSNTDEVAGYVSGERARYVLEYNHMTKERIQ